MKQARTLFLFLVSIFAAPGFSQPEVGDSTYLRMSDHATAFSAMRFDMDAYRDTLRVYRDALETTATGVDAIADEGQDRKARLGQLREDVKALDKEMKRQRKRLKQDTPPFEQSARTCSDLVRRTKFLRDRLVEQGARPRQ